MKANNLIDLAAAIVTVTLVSVVVTSPNSSKVIAAIAGAFSGALKAARG